MLDAILLMVAHNGSDKEYTLWNMVYWAQGYYQITQDIIGDCIYGNNPTESNICGKPWTDTVWQQTLWKFIPQSDGTVKIQSYYNVIHNPNNYVSLYNIATKNIRSSANTGVQQLWNIKPLRFNISVLYDQAFIDRHSSAGHINVLNGIFSANSAGKSIETNMLNRLGIHVSVQYTSTSSHPYASLPYSCGCSLLGASNIDHICNNSHSTSPYDCNNESTTGGTQLANCQAGYHHKNGNRILGEMTDISRTTSTNARILLTGFNCCNIYDGIHTPAGFYVVGWADNTKCLVMPSSSNLYGTAQHELTHILGAPDCGGKDQPNCIMGENQDVDSVINNMVLCSSCIDAIKALKYTFYQH